MATMGGTVTVVTPAVLATETVTVTLEPSVDTNIGTEVVISVGGQNINVMSFALAPDQSECMSLNKHCLAGATLSYIIA